MHLYQLSRCHYSADSNILPDLLAPALRVPRLLPQDRLLMPPIYPAHRNHSDHMFWPYDFRHRVISGRLNCFVADCKYFYTAIYIEGKLKPKAWSEHHPANDFPTLSYPDHLCVLPDPANYAQKKIYTCPNKACGKVWRIMIFEKPAFIELYWLADTAKLAPARPVTIFDEIGAGDLLD